MTTCSSENHMLNNIDNLYKCNEEDEKAVVYLPSFMSYACFYAFY